MSGSRFEFSPGWERQLEKLATDAVTKELQPILDRLSNECRGKPVEEVKEILAREWTNAVGGAITDPELTTFAQALARGERVAVR